MGTGTAVSGLTRNGPLQGEDSRWGQGVKGSPAELPVFLLDRIRMLHTPGLLRKSKA